MHDIEWGSVPSMFFFRPTNGQRPTLCLKLNAILGFRTRLLTDCVLNVEAPDTRGLAVTSENRLVVSGEDGIAIFHNGSWENLNVSYRIGDLSGINCMVGYQKYLYISDERAKCVHVLNDKGAYLQEIALPYRPSGMAIHDGMMWIATPDRKLLEIYDLAVNGGIAPGTISRKGSFLLPAPSWFVAVNEDRVAVSMFDNTVHMLQRDGKSVYKYSGEADNFIPAGLALDKNNILYIADTSNFRVIVVCRKGVLLRYIANPTNAISLLLRADRLYVTGRNKTEVGYLTSYKLTWDRQ